MTCPRRRKPHPQLSLLEPLRPVPGYDNLLASSEGLLLNRAGQVRSLHDDQRGYLQVCVKRTSDGKYVTVKAHILVALAYHGPCPQPGHLVRHKNGKRHDIRPDNLEWGSPLENAQDRDKHGTTPRGETHGRSKLTNKQVQLVAAAKGTLVEVGRAFGVSPRTVLRIRQGQHSAAPTSVKPAWLAEARSTTPPGYGRAQGRRAP